MLNVFSVATCGLYGLTDAAAATIGRYLGANRPAAARRTTRAAFGLMGGVGLVVGAAFVAARPCVGHVFARRGAGHARVWRYADHLSLIVGGAYAALSVTFACFATLQGQARPHVAAAAMFVGLWGVSVPLSYVFAFPLHLGLNGVWFGLSLGYALVSALMAGFVLASDWARFARDAVHRAERERPGTDDARDAPLLADAPPS